MNSSGFVSQKVFDLLDEKSMSFIVMLKTSNYGFTELMRRHASTIRWKVEHAVSAGLFGLVDRVKTFQTSPSEAYTLDSSILYSEVYLMTGTRHLA